MYINLQLQTRWRITALGAPRRLEFNLSSPLPKFLETLPLVLSSHLKKNKIFISLNEILHFNISSLLARNIIFRSDCPCIYSILYQNIFANLLICLLELFQPSNIDDRSRSDDRRLQAEIQNLRDENTRLRVRI